MSDNTKTIRRFKGLNNVSDPLRLGLNWLSKADNVDITDVGGIVRRDGYQKALDGAISGAYAAITTNRLFVVDGGELKQVNGDMTTVTLKTGLSSKSMYWHEVNGQIYFSNGVDAGVIMPDGEVRDWAWTDPQTPAVSAIDGNLPAGQYQVAVTFLLPDGRETGASDAAFIDLQDGQALSISNIPQIAGLATQVYIAPADSTVLQWALCTSKTAVTWNGSADELGADLTTQFLDPIPTGATMPVFWRARAYVAQHDLRQDTSVVWYSEPLGYHLFNLNQNFFMVPGEVRLLAPHKDGLIIGTDRAIYSYDGEKLDLLAEYGVVAGHGWTIDRTADSEQVYFWSQRGVCSALPFSNLTLRQISVPSGVSAGAAIIEKNGAKRFVVVLQSGGTPAYNQRGS